MKRKKHVQLRDLLKQSCKPSVLSGVPEIISHKISIRIYLVGETDDPRSMTLKIQSRGSLWGKAPWRRPRSHVIIHLVLFLDINTVFSPSPSPSRSRISPLRQFARNEYVHLCGAVEVPFHACALATSSLSVPEYPALPKGPIELEVGAMPTADNVMVRLPSAQLIFPQYCT